MYKVPVDGPCNLPFFIFYSHSLTPFHLFATTRVESKSIEELEDEENVLLKKINFIEWNESTDGKW